MSYTKYIPNTVLNITGIFIFSTIMLFFVSGNDMIKIQEKTIDDAINDFRLIFSLTNFNLTEEMKVKILNKLISNKKSNVTNMNNQLFMKAIYISIILIILTVISFYSFGEDLNISLITFNVSIITALFITEIYIYFEIIRMYKYKTKELFYNRLFYLLLGNKNIELQQQLCNSSIHEESNDFSL